VALAHATTQLIAFGQEFATTTHSPKYGRRSPKIIPIPYLYRSIDLYTSIDALSIHTHPWHTSRDCMVIRIRGPSVFGWWDSWDSMPQENTDIHHRRCRMYQWSTNLTNAIQNSKESCLWHVIYRYTLWKCPCFLFCMAIGCCTYLNKVEQMKNEHEEIELHVGP
jgi:hypothetical protein